MAYNKMVDILRAQRRANLVDLSYAADQSETGQIKR